MKITYKKVLTWQIAGGRRLDGWIGLVSADEEENCVCIGFYKEKDYFYIDTFKSAVNENRAVGKPR